MKINYRINGKEATEEEFYSLPSKPIGSPMVANTYTEHDPLISDGVGCMKSQVPEMRDTIRVHGIQGAQVMNNGQIRFTSRRARRDLLRVRKLVDNDASYGD